MKCIVHKELNVYLISTTVFTNRIQMRLLNEFKLFYQNSSSCFEQLDHGQCPRPPRIKDNAGCSKIQYKVIRANNYRQ